MSRKHRERKKAEAEASGSPATKSPADVKALRRRRNRRFLFLGVVALSFPILEVIAYQFRTITITIVNRTREPLQRLKVSYDGGAFDADEVKPDGVLTRVIRPDFSFKGDHALTYQMSIRFASGTGFMSQIGRVGSLDFSATEIYTVVAQPPDGHIQLQHTTRPGFPLSLVRDVAEKLGLH